MITPSLQRKLVTGSVARCGKEYLERVLLQFLVLGGGQQQPDAVEKEELAIVGQHVIGLQLHHKLILQGCCAYGYQS